MLMDRAFADQDGKANLAMNHVQLGIMASSVFLNANVQIIKTVIRSLENVIKNVL